MTSNDSNRFLQQWHKIIKDKDFAQLHNILHKDIVFRTPVYHKQRKGNKIVTAILASAIDLFNREGDNFKYHREWISDDGRDFCLEFSSIIEGKIIKGVDLIHINSDGQIIEFEVMLRPAPLAVRFGELQGENIPVVLKKMGINAKL